MVVEVGLRRLPLTRLAACLGVPLGLEPTPEPDSPAGGQEPGTADVRRAAAATRLVLRRWPAGDTCLRRALVTGHLLRAGRPRLRLGVGPGDLGPTAHAWVELADGRSIAGPGEGIRPLLARGSPRAK